ncbi:MAG: CehA/McbA family metallohydrolase [Candidatus Aminicenantes bacterium]|nr:CehA/McbA family metallohydrolase [Candidatus Aminicenantes bacterium]
MCRRWALLGLLLILSAFILYQSLIAYRYQGWSARKEPIPLLDGYYDYSGIIHCHSVYSDGSGTVEEIMEAANRAEADFVILTDHDERLALADGKEGWYKRSLLLVGEEPSTQAGHLLGLGIPDAVWRFGPEPQEAIEDIKELNGLAFIAHPYHPRNRWMDWTIRHHDGIEIFNGDTLWRMGGWYRLGVELLTYPVNPFYSLLSAVHYPYQNIRKWDELSQKRAVVGIAGSDAHGVIPLFGRGRGINIPSYEAIFKVMRNHILTSLKLSGSLGRDKGIIYDSLRQGHCYISFDGLGDPRGFFFSASNGEQKALMGDSLPLTSHVTLFIQQNGPSGTEVLLFRNGTLIARDRRTSFRYPVSRQGVYRVEVYLPQEFLPTRKRFPWIISNPIYIGRQLITSASETDIISLSEIEHLPEQALMVDDFESKQEGKWTVESNPSSYVDKKGLIDRTGGAQNSSASLRFKFKLASPEHSNNMVWCAIGERSERDLTEYDRVRFWVKSDQVYRILFQLREHDPSGGKEKLEEWGRTFKTYPHWELREMKLEDLYLLTKGTNRIMEPSRVRGIFFIVNQQNTRPGTQGTIWFDDISFIKKRVD